MTYKLSGQYEGDAETYKSVEEVAYWKSRDPLLSYKAKILEIDPTVESQFSTYESENHDLVVEAFERASKDPFPTIEEMYQAVYLEEEAQV